MKRALKFIISLILLILIAAATYIFGIVVPQQDAKMNSVVHHVPYPVSKAAKALHADLLIADLHSDSLLWRRNPEKRWDRGCLLYTSPSPRDATLSRMPSSA